jgi:hydrogenase-4 component B
MHFLLFGVITLGVGAVLTLILPNNRVRVGVNLVSQAIACCCILTETIPILLGGTALSGVLEWSYPIEKVNLRVDALGAFFLTFSVPMTLLGSLYAVGYLAHDIRGPRHVGMHFALLSLLQFSYMVIYTVQNAFAFLVGWEIAALSAWLLVIWDHRNQKIRFAGFNYLVSTHLGLLFLVAAIMIMHGETKSFQFLDFEAFLGQPSIQRNIAFVLLMTSFGLKSAFFPFHSWLPRAHSAAPAHVSALMSGVIHKAGLFGMLKFILMVGKPDLWMGWYLLGVSVVSAFMGVLYTISQRDIKRLLGYSSTENVGIAGIGIGMGCLGLSTGQPILAAFGFGGGLLHILNHALFKCLLFYGAGAIYRFTHTIDLEKLGGLSKVMRWTAPLFLLGSFASAALPPFNGFLSEFILYLGLLQPVPELGSGRASLLLVIALLALVGGLSALSITRAFGLIFLGTPRDQHHVAPQKAREHPCMIAPMVIHLIGILVIGLVPAIGLRLVEAPTGLFLKLSTAPDTHLSELVPHSLVQSLTMLGVVLAATLGGLMILRFALLPRCNRRHVTWGCGYTAPNARMQYTGSSFSHPMVTVFWDILTYLSREDLPKGVFPKDGQYDTHCVDSVEKSMFKFLSDGESVVTRVMRYIPEDTRFSCGLGLASLVLWVMLISLR